jgi:hypothetical protein
MVQAADSRGPGREQGSGKSPAHKEQHLCADKAYDAEEVREFASSVGYITHIKVNP